MLGGVKMLGRVSVGRAIAAADMAANQANTEMDPPATDFQALFTAFGAGGNLLDLTYMRAFHHKFLGRDLASLLSKFHQHTVGDCCEETGGIGTYHGFPRYNWLTAKRAFAILCLGDPPSINGYVIHT